MHRRSFCSLLALAACAHATPDRPRTRKTPRTPVDPTAALGYAAANNAFAFDLWQAIRSRPGNLTISPASISMALGMTWAGARGETARAMGNALHLADVDTDTKSMASQLAAWNDPDRTAFELRVVDRLFGEKTVTFDPAYLQLVRDRFGAPLEPVDFKTAFEPARKRINDWVEEQTKDRIVDLLPQGSIDADTTLVLTNAVYFKGEWEHAFTTDATYAAEFHVDGSRAVQVPTMHRTGPISYHGDAQLQAIELPYTGGELAMVVILPRAKDGLAALEQSLDETSLGDVLAKLRTQEVALALPKLKLEMSESLTLRKPLEQLGMGPAFRDDADFTGISKEIPVKISDVAHKTFVIVDEEGTEAAAATGVVMTTATSVAPPPEAFTADRPFVYLIRDVKSGAILFLGRVTDPS